MQDRPNPRRPKVAVALALCLPALAYAQPSPDAEAPFLAQNQTAMDRMMANMTIKPTGDVDRDFTMMMIPHHQGAIDMALAELRYGRNELLRRIAQGIIVEQQQEIAAMRLALGQPLPPPVAAPDQPAALRSAPTQGDSHNPTMTMQKEQ